ncbi:MAG: hypothetical protein ABJA37_00945 [Ferruginibacter sp.]
MKTLALFFSIIFNINYISAQSSQTAQPVSLSVYKSASKIKITSTASGYVSGLKISEAVVSVDTSIRVSPKTAYLSIDFSSITGTSLDEILNGTNSFWIVDKTGKAIKSSEKFLKKVKGSMENQLVDYTVKIPYKLKADLNTAYTVRYLWESKDKKKTIDIVATR